MPIYKILIEQSKSNNFKLLSSCNEHLPLL